MKAKKKYSQFTIVLICFLLLGASLTRSFAFVLAEEKKKQSIEQSKDNDQESSTEKNNDFVVYEYTLDALIPVGSASVYLPQYFKVIFSLALSYVQYQVDFYPLENTILLSYFENVFSSLIIPNAP